jgi:hypothetical protein
VLLGDLKQRKNMGAASSMNDRVWLYRTHSHESPLVVGLEEVLSKRAGHGCARVRKGDEGSRTKNALIESSLRFARPASRTRTEVVGSSDKRDATTRPAVCACELTGRVRRGNTYSTACCTD